MPKPPGAAHASALFVTHVQHAVVAHPLLIPFCGGLMGGEETVFLLSVAAAHGYLDIGKVAVGCYAGIWIADVAWYFFGKTRLFDWLVKRKGVSETYRLLRHALVKTTAGNDFLALLTTKFLYGFRLITIMQLSREGMAWAAFALSSAVVDALWIATVVTAGWFAGKGMEFVRLASHNLAISFAFLGVIMVGGVTVMRLASRRLRKWLIQRQKPSN